MNLADDEVLKMLKSGFGDVRAPRLWYDKAVRDLCQIGVVRHPLDRCVFMSFEGVDLPKSVSEGMERLNGIHGLHVDDFVGGGEGMSHVAVKGWNHVPAGVPSFASRVKMVENEAGIGKHPFGFEFSFHWNPADTVIEFRMYSFVTGKLFTESKTHCTEQRTPTKSPRRNDCTGETSVTRFEWLYELASDTTDALWSRVSVDTSSQR